MLTMQVLLVLIPLIVRLIPAEYMLDLKSSCINRFEPVLREVKRLQRKSGKKQLVIAIDGKCASGKSTLGLYLKNSLDANLFHMDDFFLRPEQRTPERFA